MPSPSVSVARGENRLRVDPDARRVNAGSSASDDIGDRWAGDRVDEHATQILLERFALARSATRKFVSDVVGNVSYSDRHWHAASLAATQMDRMHLHDCRVARGEVPVKSG